MTWTLNDSSYYTSVELKGGTYTNSLVLGEKNLLKGGTRDQKGKGESMV